MAVPSVEHGDGAQLPRLLSGADTVSLSPARASPTRLLAAPRGPPAGRAAPEPPWDRASVAEPNVRRARSLSAPRRAGLASGNWGPLRQARPSQLSAERPGTANREGRGGGLSCALIHMHRDPHREETEQRSKQEKKCLFAS